MENQFPTNYHLIEAVYVPATDTKGSCVRVKSHRYGQEVRIPFGNHGNSRDAAQEWLEARGYAIVGQAESGKSYFLLSTTFKPFKP